MLHSSIQIFPPKRDNIDIRLSHLGLHQRHGQQHADTFVSFDGSRYGTHNMVTLAGHDLTRNLLKPVRMILTGRNAHKSAKIVLLTKVLHIPAEFHYCLFLFFCNHFCNF